jgi:hypothetical protein
MDGVPARHHKATHDGRDDDEGADDDNHGLEEIEPAFRATHSKLKSPSSKFKRSSTGQAPMQTAAQCWNLELRNSLEL